MVKKSKLLLALDAHKGRDYKREYQKKLTNAADKRKKAKSEQSSGEQLGQTKKKPTDSNTNAADKELSDNDAINGAVADEDGDSTGDNEVQDDQDEEQESPSHAESEGGEEHEDEDNEEEDAEEEDVPLSDLSGDERNDVIPHQRLTINNSTAIAASIKRISFLTPQTPFSEHNSLVSSEMIEVPDPNDDLNRELAFYKVCQAAAISARKLLKKEGIPFSRPKDFFAEMVKSDEHMGKIKEKLFEEAAAKKAAAEARRQRDLKKFGKQVQIAKLQQRQKEKKETLEKINSLKKKRKASQSGPMEDEDLFDVAIEDASKSEIRPKRRADQSDETGVPSKKRQKKNEKYGFGGRKRFSKSGDALSSGDLRGFSVKKMKNSGGGRKGAGGAATAKRPGKTRRKAMKA
ncbi:hypothetical protein Egran_04499 [Elaphomyces granulatus]|uniref:Uncharacterized protein n=1 Tax=Elaphomyces granulatus TaxID=519963 RepID=A0A232LUG9_9EURO|nr:hypothetical protein Egran_04499 [Elaphomyces granulatus]